MGRVRQDAGLGAGEGHGLKPSSLDRHRCQRHGDAFARREEHVHLACWRVGVDCSSEVDEFVRRLPHGGDHDDDVTAFATGLDDAIGHGRYAVGASDGGAPVFLNNKCHVRS